MKWQRRHQCVWICFILPDALQSSVGRATSCVNQIEPDNCLIHLEPIFVPESWKQQPLAFLQPRLKNCKCLQKKKREEEEEEEVARRRGAPAAPSLSDVRHDNSVHKEPCLSYLSSCFRYFCKLRGGRIINHRQTRWQSASAVAKETNETTQTGKWPGDPPR